jgi:dTDP-4-amino-4,6-dideoxygalactose transaminase
LQEYLDKSGIETAIHYPIPIHLQPAAKELGYRRGDFPITERQADRILSLPIQQFLTVDDQAYVADRILAFFEGA